MTALLLLLLQAGSTPPESLPEAMSRLYPERAQRFDMEGVATLECRMTEVGGLEACSVASEAPADFGFGDAALQLAPLIKLKPLPDTVGKLVRLPINFRLPEEAHVGQPRWQQTPTSKQAAAAYPRGATAGGRVVLRCLIDPFGALTGCGVSEETPAGSGLADEAQHLALKFRADPRRYGEARWISVTFTFDPKTRNVSWSP